MKKIKFRKITIKKCYFFYSENKFSKLLYKIENETFFSISNFQRKTIIDKINNSLHELIDFKINSIFFLNSQNKNICFYKSADIIGTEEKKIIASFIKQYFYLLANIKINFELSNIYKTHINDKYLFITDLHKKVNNLLITKGELDLSSYTKKYRKKINEFIMKYKSIKIKSVGPFGERRIKIIYKPEK
ncbi:hypothetical protein [Spiroplasma turonicum]|uniref:Uncharacterized protein n=1 Tax=Spiroplasma turonicum TaxID=216946 RepID=A0A0K1P7P0_9MOLU|nr:hypothetical protein [Spiroplasma turonicum]AKU80331.1 hypothetical protein STURON_001085 [Spiroplasma turonicum]ALX71332.1 hypothetical protein STURO_v1c10810 [Spiroplasma turonicum]